MKEVIRQGLTKEPQTPYPKYGDNFMSGEPGRPENPQRSIRQEVSAPSAKPMSERQATARRILEESKDLPVALKGALESVIQEEIAGNKHASNPSPPKEEILREYNAVRDLIGKLPKTSVFGDPKVTIPKEIMPDMPMAENIVKGEREAANLPKGVEAYNLNPVNVVGVTDPGLKQIGERIRSRLERNLMDYREVEKNIGDLEGALKNLPAGSPDEPWARTLYDDLYNEVVRQRQLAGEVNWEKVKEDLMNATRAGDLKTIEDIVRKSYDFNERINVNDLVEVSLSNEAIASGAYGYALEYVLESIINVADLTPLGTIPTPTFVQSENISRLIKGTLDMDQDENKDFYKYLKELQERRQLSHELYKSMSTRGAYQKYVGEHLKNDGFHYLENEIAGVSEIQGLWEKVMAREVGKKKKVLSQREFDEVHEEVRRLFRINANLDANGTSQKLKKERDLLVGRRPVHIERPLREWEINRAAVVGRSVAHVTGRAITYGTLGDLPDKVDELFDSMNAEYVARITAARKVMGQRFLAGGFSASKLYIEQWIKNKIKGAAYKGQIYGEGEKTLYGQKLESWIYLDTSVPELLTHGWRNKRTQLKNSKFAKLEVNGEKTTIGDYLDKEWDKIKVLKGPALEREISALGTLTLEEQEFLDNSKTILISKNARMQRILYSRNVRDTVLSQRLYLSALLREGDFTAMLKEEIWKKVAEFLPSRIAAFFPQERENIIRANGTKMSDREWKDLSDKLFMAEMDRTRRQSELVYANNFITQEQLSNFYIPNGITDPQDIDYINKIIELGRNKAKMLSNMIFPQSAFLDDAPEPQWMNLGKETVGRLLVNDYEGYDIANNETGAIIANPSMKLEESAAHLIKAKDGYASPLGLEDAQDRLEADVETRYDLYAMDTSSKWGLYSINRWRRKPTSLIEKSNVDANISMDEKAIAQDIDFLSQNTVVNNDRGKLDFVGHTQSERIKERKKARVRDVWLRSLRIFLMLFPGAFGEEFIRIIAPDLLKTK